MRIAHVVGDAGVLPGRRKGAAVHVDAMRRAFAALGAEVVAVDEPAPDAAAAALAAAHAERALDLVYERYALGAFAAGRFAREHGLPHVLEVNAPLAEEEALWRGGARLGYDERAERELFAGAARVLAVASPIRAYCEARGADPARVRVTPNAVDPKRFAPRAAGDALRAELVPAGRLALGFHGRLRPWHGLETLASAAADLVRRGVDVHLVAVGEGPFARALEGRLPPERATLLGWRPHAEVARVVACFDVLPLAYAADKPFWFSPLKLAEAMAAGVVPVVPDLGDLAAEVRHDERGLVYPAGDVDALSDAIAALAGDPARRARLGRAAREHARGRTWTEIARDVLGLADGPRAHGPRPEVRA